MCRSRCTVERVLKRAARNYGFEKRKKRKNNEQRLFQRSKISRFLSIIGGSRPGCFHGASIKSLSPPRGVLYTVGRHLITVTLIELTDLSTPSSLGPIMPSGWLPSCAPNDAKDRPPKRTIKSQEPLHYAISWCIQTPRNSCVTAADRVYTACWKIISITANLVRGSGNTNTVRLLTTVFNMRFRLLLLHSACGRLLFTRGFWVQCIVI